MDMLLRASDFSYSTDKIIICGAVFIFNNDEEIYLLNEKIL
jgi:hypothetical protein